MVVVALAGPSHRVVAEFRLVVGVKTHALAARSIAVQEHVVEGHTSTREESVSAR